MRSTRLIIHLRSARMPLTIPIVHRFQQLFNTLSHHIFNILYENPFILALMDAESFVLILTQQILNLIIVNLNVGASDQKFLIIFTLVLNDLENMGERTRDYSSLHLVHGIRSHHCIGFATSGLSVGENCAIEAFCNRFNKMESSFLI